MLRRALPALATRAWVGATVAGTLVAWSLGLVPALGAARLGELPMGAQVAVTAVLAAAMVAALSVFQWRVLRGHVRSARLWMPANAVAWLLGLAVFLTIATPLSHEGQAAPAVAVVTGAALVRIWDRPTLLDRILRERRR